jgi:hydroxypyruvate isomerase
VDFSANISLLFSELPFLDRPAAAKEAGFDHIECWWPFDTEQPSDEQIDAFISSIADADVALTALNLYAGDMAAGERGVLSWPERTAELVRSMNVIATCAQATGVRAFNALYGQRRDGLSAVEQDAVAYDNLAMAAEVVAATGGVLLIEPLTQGENGRYPLLTLDDATRIVQAVRDRHGATNLALLFDTYHLAGNGVGLLTGLRSHGHRIGHVQVADHPGRGEPGTGAIDFPAVFETLERIGYDGFVGCEYRPVGDTVAGLAWLHRLT